MADKSLGIYDAELETGDYLEQKTPNGKSRINFDKESVDASSALYANNREEFHDFDDQRSEISATAYLAGNVIYKKSQRDEFLRQRVGLNPTKVKANEIAALYKIIMLGDSGSGKTSMLLRFAENIFNPLQNCTIGVDFKIKQVKIDDRVVKL